MYPHNLKIFANRVNLNRNIATFLYFALNFYTMSDKFFPQNLNSLLLEILEQLNSKSEVLGLAYNQIFNPDLFPHLKMKR
jgi:hypothetical protein